jgi:hypothetical protein
MDAIPYFALFYLKTVIREIKILPPEKLKFIIKNTQ